MYFPWTEKIFFCNFVSSCTFTCQFHFCPAWHLLHWCLVNSRSSNSVLFCHLICHCVTLVCWFDLFREQFLKSNAQLTFRCRQLLSELSYIYPIEMVRSWMSTFEFSFQWSTKSGHISGTHPPKSNRNRRPTVNLCQTVIASLLNFHLVWVCF